MEYKFEIIPNEQTPAIREIPDKSTIKEYIEIHREELEIFLKFASEQETAVGLAANQTSVNGERFTIRAFALKNLEDQTWSLVIDPIITNHIGIEEFQVEGCLTWKGMKIIAQRHRAVRVRYFTMDGTENIDEIYKGYEGQIWQHEINHLNGIEEQVEEKTYPNPRPLTANRNEPCPCGSGKKYKKCCLLLI